MTGFDPNRQRRCFSWQWTFLSFDQLGLVATKPAQGHCPLTQKQMHMHFFSRCGLWCPSCSQCIWILGGVACRCCAQILRCVQTPHLATSQTGCNPAAVLAHWWICLEHAKTHAALLKLILKTAAVLHTRLRFRCHFEIERHDTHQQQIQFRTCTEYRYDAVALFKSYSNFNSTFALQNNIWSSKAISDSHLTRNPPWTHRIDIGLCAFSIVFVGAVRPINWCSIGYIQYRIWQSNSISNI